MPALLGLGVEEDQDERRHRNRVRARAAPARRIGQVALVVGAVEVAAVPAAWECRSEVQRPVRLGSSARPRTSAAPRTRRNPNRLRRATAAASRSGHDRRRREGAAAAAAHAGRLGVRRVRRDRLARRSCRRARRTGRCTSRVTFPGCWNGRDLDSADHKRHLAYATSGRCPRSHAGRGCRRSSSSSSTPQPNSDR